MKSLLILPGLFLLTTCAWAGNIKILSLNLHGYHPMGEEKRYLEDRSGKKHLTSSHIHYFKEEEFIRGNKNRLNHLARDLNLLRPDIIFLQEVGAGGPHQNNKNCLEFYHNYEQDNDFENTSYRLEKRLRQLGENYTNLPACRGNLGWYTGANQFEKFRVVTKDSKIIFDFGSNPYPSGILIEGSSIMVSKRFKVLDHIIYNDSYNYLGHKFFYQMAVVQERSTKDWLLLVNIHAGHKITHFEQSLLIKRNLLNYLSRNNHEGNFKGIIVGGDFNARLYRPNKDNTYEKFSEVSTIFYEVKKVGEFDFLLDGRDDLSKLTTLKNELILLNNSGYKPWASIQNEDELNTRLNQALYQFKTIQKDYLNGPYSEMLLMSSSLEMANQMNRCDPLLVLNGVCQITARIDFIMKTRNFNIINSYVLYSKNNWTSLDFVTDHPGILSHLEF